ncbi:hypothetical protein CK216_27905 [Mesorhizobium sp. WSM3876]|nr:hypothetical protein CK216_27905 [Mesorhizobium sp. WSM3876]
MTPHPQTTEALALVQKLVAETGVSEAQAWELVFLLGINWASLVREAKIMARQPKAGTGR